MADAWPHKGGWASNEAQVQIAKKLNQGNVALVLGAGVSFFYGLPSWAELLGGLKNNGLSHGIAKIDDYPQWAQNILEGHFACDERAFIDAVHTGLYGVESAQLEINKIADDPSLRAIGSLGVGKQRGVVDTIVTFNYDSILESYFEHHGLTVVPILSENQPIINADIKIYHPHGFLPHPETKYTRSDGIVLTTKQYSDTTSTPWESTLENLFATRFCIFIGLSGDDERLAGLLGKVNRRNEHSKAEYYWGYRLCLKDDRNIAFWEEHGVFSVEFEANDFAVGVNNTLLNICRLAVAE